MATLTQNEITRLINVITPEIFNQYMREQTAEKSRFVQSGIAVANEAVSRNIDVGGLFVNMPFWNDLSGVDEILDDGGRPLTTDKITAALDIAAVLYRGKGWATNELTGIIAGDDPMAALLARISDWWLRQEQSVLLSVMRGLFDPGGTLAPTHLNDRADYDIDGSLILDTKQLLGDAHDRVNMLMMHSAVYTELQKQQMIEYIQPAGTNVRIPYYLEYAVDYDDGLPFDPTTGVFTTYLFGRGSIGRNSGNPSKMTTFEADRDKARGNDMVYTRRAITMHPHGIAFKNNERAKDGEGVQYVTPSNGDLASVANWELVYEPKNVALLALKHKVKDFVPTPLMKRAALGAAPQMAAKKAAKE